MEAPAFPGTPLTVQSVAPAGGTGFETSIQAIGVDFDTVTAFPMTTLTGSGSGGTITPDSVTGTYNNERIDFITNANRLNRVNTIYFSNEQLD